MPSVQALYNLPEERPHSYPCQIGEQIQSEHACQSCGLDGTAEVGHHLVGLKLAFLHHWGCVQAVIRNMNL